jgi:hypothetical protein
MLIASLVFALFTGPSAQAAESCGVLFKRPAPKMSALKTLEKDRFYVGDNITQIYSPIAGEALFVATGQFGRTIVRLDINEKTVVVEDVIDGVGLRYQGHVGIATAADGKTFAIRNMDQITVIKPTKKGFKTIRKESYSSHMFNWQPWVPDYYVHDGQTYQFGFLPGGDYTRDTMGVAVGFSRKKEISYASVVKTPGELAEFYNDGNFNFSYDANKRVLNVLEIATGEVKTQKFRKNKALQFDEIDISSVERLKDGSVLFNGRLGWILLDPNFKLVNQGFYQNSNGEVIQRRIHVDFKTWDVQGEMIVFPSEKFAAYDGHYKSENQAVTLLNTRTGKVETLDIPEVMRVFLNKDGTIVVQTYTQIQILDAQRKVIKAFELPGDRLSSRRGNLTRVDDKTYLYTWGPGNNRLIQL